MNATTKKLWKRLLLTVVAIAVTLAVAAWIILTWVLTRPTSYSPTVDVGPIVLRSWDEHDSIYTSKSFPYVLSIENKHGALEYVGARHTSDAAAPQLVEIERRWTEFKPTVALCEGRSRMYRFASRNKTGTLSESDLTRIMANRAGIPLFTLEPNYEAEVAGLLKQFDAKLVATYMTVRVYSAEASQTENMPVEDQNQLAKGLLRKRTNVTGLQNSISNIAELDDYWQQTFPSEPDWRTLPNTESVPLLRSVGDVSRQVRGEHMVRTITELVNNGNRVFAVVGASHVIRQEPVLKRLLETKPGSL